MRANNWVPLYSITRGDLEEVTVHGAMAAWSNGKLVHSVGKDILVFARSLLKPFQMKVFSVDLALDLSPDEQAISVASHAGEERHLQVVELMSDICTRSAIKIPLKHTCSGKHTGILRGCEKRGWPVDTYTSMEHPYFAALLTTLREYLGKEWKPAITAVDGCGLPTVSMAPAELACLYAELAARRKSDWVWQAMTEHSEIIGGKGRLDTSILKIGEGRVVAKEGADGLLGLSILNERYPHGLGVVVKIAHGYDQSALAIMAREILRGFGYTLPTSPLYHTREIVPRAQLSIP